ncbi:efflux RND transporter periplasmic adaptor subunit [Chitiniphilus shinanonensis]|uniref:efflux RND transporter periplasmic adaptor subunit n=1 Tax=Chitiniphilus shinanonensis TaxID=553088 RepID=UPI0004780262|nr:efflux RND transporter periplasmic adaptor subunit [Chitiniphilus shinanonensis]
MLPLHRIWPVVLSSLLLAACGQPEPPREEIRPVRVIRVGAPQSAPGAELTGTVRAHTETPLSFRIGGKLVERQVDVGAVVKRGQAIARIDPQDASLNATAADAQAAAAKAQQAQAQMDYERAQRLFEQKFVSQAEVDNRRTALDAAREAARQAQAQRELARNQAGYTTLLADADGVVTQVAAEPGQVLAAGQPVVTLAHQGEREIAVDVPEQLRGAVKVGDAVTVRLWALPGRTLPGRVSELSPAADAAARTYPARIAFEHDAAVQLGMSASVRLATPAARPTGSALEVPLTALFGETGKQQVWLLDLKAGRVQARAVQVLGVTDDAALVRGVRPGDLVVTAGAHLLREGQRVKRLGAANEGAGA